MKADDPAYFGDNNIPVGVDRRKAEDSLARLAGGTRFLWLGYVAVPLAALRIIPGAERLPRPGENVWFSGQWRTVYLA